MTDQARDQLAVVAADPERVEDVRPDEVPVLLGRLEELRARLWGRLQAPTPPPSDGAPADRSKHGHDQLLDAGEAAKRLGVDRRWIYRHAESLPFTTRLGPRTLRFSERGLDRWLETRNN